MKRRTFLKIIGFGGAASLAAPAVLFFEPRPDVRGWRFGVWTIVKRYGFCHVNPDATLSTCGQEYYSCRCDCGTERVVGLNELLSVDALSCAHVRHRGFFCISPDAMHCQNCGDARRFFFNGDGMRIWRCANGCEEADVRAGLRREYGPTSSIQFTANMAKGRTIQPTDPRAKYTGIVRKTAKA